MTNKIYRLADERDAGKPVFFANNLGNIVKEGRPLIGTLLAYEPHKWTCYKIIPNDDGYLYALIEVTPADFDTDDLLTEMIKRYIKKDILGESHCWRFDKDGNLKEKSLADFDTNELLKELTCRAKSDESLMETVWQHYHQKEKVPSDFPTDQLTTELKNRIANGEVITLLSDAYEAGLKAGQKGKPLADFSDKEIENEAAKRNRATLDFVSGGIIEHARLIAESQYKKGYEAGKRDSSEASKMTILQLVNAVKSYCDSTGADVYKLFDIKRDTEPKWVSCEERLPTKDKFYWCASKQHQGYDDIGPVSLSISFCKGRWETNREITHWMELLSPPSEPQPEQKPEELIELIDEKFRPLYTCACGRKITKSDDMHQYMSKLLCSKKCAAEFKKTQESFSCKLRNPGEPKYTCAHCGTVLSAVGSIMNYKAQIFCNTQCAEDYEWIDAEFPRDYGNPCRFKDTSSLEWQQGTVSGKLQSAAFSNPYIVEDRLKAYSFAFACQVRRDSVEEK